MGQKLCKIESRVQSDYNSTITSHYSVTQSYNISFRLSQGTI